jgi:hypothetical protein
MYYKVITATRCLLIDCLELKMDILAKDVTVLSGISKKTNEPWFAFDEVITQRRFISVFDEKVKTVLLDLAKNQMTVDLVLSLDVSKNRLIANENLLNG